MKNSCKIVLLSIIFFLSAFIIYSQNIVLNGDLESWDDPNTPTDWTKAENITQATTPVHGETYSAMHTSASGTKDLKQNVMSITGGETYTISYWYLDNDPEARTRIWAYWLQDETTTLPENGDVLRPSEYSEDNPEWINFSIDLTAPPTATGFRFEVRVYKQDNIYGGSVYYDDFSITVIPDYHFNFEGGNPSDPFWTLYIAEASLNGIDLEAGDEIAIFDGEIMVGAMVLIQVCTPDNQFENVLLAFSTLAGGSSGYTPGNEVSLKCWDASLAIEVTILTIIFDNPYGDAWTQNIFPYDNGEYSIVNINWINLGNLIGTISNAENSQPIEGALIEVSGSLYYNTTSDANGNYLIEDVENGTYSINTSAEGYFPQTINGVEILAGETITVNFYMESIIKTQIYNLIIGYQFVSSRLISENPDMQNILEEILNNLDFVRNSEGYMLRKIGPNWINSIGDWVTTEGYLFKMNNNDQLTITGVTIDPQTPINLSTGYQIVSYLPAQPNNALDMFEDVLENLDFVRNTGGYMIQKIGPIWVNSIGDMQPGEGYLVKMLANDVLIYPINSSFVCDYQFTDTRDGQIYNTVQIGDQCWMAENLNIGSMINSSENMSNDGIIEKYCYDDDPTNCDEYGGLYQWNEMMEYNTTPGVQGICPSGWHLPTDGEWKILEGTIDSQYPVGNPIWNNTGWRGFDAGLNLKSTSGWISGGNGTNVFGFTALSGGYRNSIGNFYYIGEYAFFWTSTEYNSDFAWYRDLCYNNDEAYRAYSTIGNGFPVRCLQNETK